MIFIVLQFSKAQIQEKEKELKRDYKILKDARKHKVEFLGMREGV
jgi:hypothetical protein